MNRIVSTQNPYFILGDAQYMAFKTLFCLVVLIVTVFLVEFSVYYSQNIQPNDRQSKASQDGKLQKDSLEHDVFSNKDLRKDFNNSTSKRRVLLIVGIVSAPSRPDRRHAIRQTWMQACKENPNIICRFFSDSLSNVDRKWKEQIRKEHLKHKDIEFMTVPRGINFGLRMLWLIDWSVNKFDFEFLLRLDDDYFVCLEMLVKDLETRKTKCLYWGYFHCHKKQVRADEAFLILSKDIIQTILRKRDKLFCSPFGDQSVAMWMKLIYNVTFFHDGRLLHNGLHTDQNISTNQICNDYIGIHHVYPKRTFALWKSLKSQKAAIYKTLDIQPFAQICKFSKTFDWRSMSEGYRIKPDRCINNPVWKGMKMWNGEGGGTEVHWSKRRTIIN